MLREDLDQPLPVSNSGKEKGEKPPASPKGKPHPWLGKEDHL